MRFFKNGPPIPDALLTARDDGRVVFFCGAGISMARAGLPDFFGLAKSVTDQLRVQAEHPACKIIHGAHDIDEQFGVNGLISADQIFGLLERDFSIEDIEETVAKVLHPVIDVDLSAHQILLDLATTPEGRVQLVTTNFDRLFRDCSADLKIWQPPRLPDPSRPSELNGIVHLHGYANADYTGSEGDGFVLTSSVFGRAYLAEGWATRFFKGIIEERFAVVFIGYKADDPPVRYLLEGLNKRDGGLSDVYALQGSTSETAARWVEKGVKAISYTENDNH